MAMSNVRFAVHEEALAVARGRCVGQRGELIHLQCGQEVESQPVQGSRGVSGPHPALKWIQRPTMALDDNEA
eukprot:3171159-Amphidinium_carterae.2